MSVCQVHVQIGPFDVQFGPENISWLFRSSKRTEMTKDRRRPRTELTIPPLFAANSATSRLILFDGMYPQPSFRFIAFLTLVLTYANL